MEVISMDDVIAIGLVLIFLVASFGLLKLCQQLMEG
jgi:hypothetical protein